MIVVSLSGNHTHSLIHQQVYIHVWEYVGMEAWRYGIWEYVGMGGMEVWDMEVCRYGRHGGMGYGGVLTGMDSW